MRQTKRRESNHSTKDSPDHQVVMTRKQEQRPISREKIMITALLTLVPVMAVSIWIVVQRSPTGAQETGSPLLAEQLESGAAGRKLRMPMVGDVYMDYCYISSGSMALGSTPDNKMRSRDGQRFEVVFENHFWMARTQVTQKQYQTIMNRQPSVFSGPDHPVENVSWEDAQEFVERLNKRAILPKRWSFSLPSEMQWEYACKAGTQSEYSGGSLDEVGWYSSNSKSKTQPVAFKKPNPWGLHDMHGNVWEWCSDWFTSQFLTETDPGRAFMGIMKVKRGGSWGSGAEECKSSSRRGSSPTEKNSLTGFRTVIIRVN